MRFLKYVFLLFVLPCYSKTTLVGQQSLMEIYSAIMEKVAEKNPPDITEKIKANVGGKDYFSSLVLGKKQKGIQSKSKKTYGQLLYLTKVKNSKGEYLDISDNQVANAFYGAPIAFCPYKDQGSISSMAESAQENINFTACIFYITKDTVVNVFNRHTTPEKKTHHFKLLDYPWLVSILPLGIIGNQNQPYIRVVYYDAIPPEGRTHYIADINHTYTDKTDHARSGGIYLGFLTCPYNFHPITGAEEDLDKCTPILGDVLYPYYHGDLKFVESFTHYLGGAVEIAAFFATWEMGGFGKVITTGLKTLTIGALKSAVISSLRELTFIKMEGQLKYTIFRGMAEWMAMDLVAESIAGTIELVNESIHFMDEIPFDKKVELLDAFTVKNMLDNADGITYSKYSIQDMEHVIRWSIASMQSWSKVWSTAPYGEDAINGNACEICANLRYTEEGLKAAEKSRKETDEAWKIMGTPQGYLLAVPN